MELMNCINPQNDTSDKTIRAIMTKYLGEPRPLIIVPFSSDYDSVNKPKFAPQKLVIVLDDSGSTNNTFHGTGTRGQPTGTPAIQPVDKTKPITPPIIIAECEGICTIMIEYMRLFDMAGTEIWLIPFSTKFQVIKFVPESNLHLYTGLLKRLDLIDYEGGNTRLFPPMEYICNHILNDINHTHVILATDGRADEQHRVINLLNNIKSKWRFFIIGAGSIQKSIGSDGSNICQTRSCVNGIVCPRDHTGTIAIAPELLNLTPVQLTDKTFVAKIMSGSKQPDIFRPPIRSGSSDSECDAQYLEQLAYIGTAEIGYYSGAFGDYQVLRKSAVEYLTAILSIDKKSAYKVLLNDGQHGSLPNIVSDLLCNHTVVLCKTEFGYYIITTKWQIAIKPVTFPNDVTAIGFNKLDDKLYGLEYDMLKNSIPLTKVQIGDISCIPLVDFGGFYRIRRIVQI